MVESVPTKSKMVTYPLMVSYYNAASPLSKGFITELR